MELGEEKIGRRSCEEKRVIEAKEGRKRSCKEERMLEEKVGRKRSCEQERV